jgi:hypothetical protein
LRPKQLFGNNKIAEQMEAYGSVDKNYNIPYPHLAAFISKRTGNQFGKRMRFAGIKNSKETFMEQFKQIQENEVKRKMEKYNLKHQEHQEMMKLKEDNIRDDIEREIDHKAKQLQFKHEMDQMKVHKRLVKEQEKAAKFSETYDYFPYTHGENIENMKDRYRALALEEERTINNSSINVVGFHSAQKIKNKTLDSFNKTGIRNPIANEYTFEHKKSNHLRSTERHPEVIASALRRFENSLLEREQAKIMEDQNFKDQIEHNRSYEIMIKDKQTTEKQRNRETLLRHMQENKKKQLKDLFDRKKYVRTNYGPEESNYTLIRQAQKKQQDLEELKRELEKQVDLKQKVKD